MRSRGDEMHESKSIRIIDTDFNKYGEIDDYEFLRFTRRYHEPGDFELRINANKNYALELKRDRIIYFTDNISKAGIIKEVRDSLDNKGQASDKIVVIGSTLSGIAKTRITYPESGQSHQSFSNEYEENIMKDMVEFNMVDADDTNRNISFVTIEPKENRGSQIDDKTRYKILSEELKRISLGSGLGWDFVIDPINKAIKMIVYEGLDRTIGQNINQRAVFSTTYDNVQKQEYINSSINYSNHAIVGGQGEGASRTIQEVGSQSGYDRKEVFIDARDLTTVSELTTRGEQKLEELDIINVFNAEVATVTNLTYETDYDLGDIVTFRYDRRNITLDTRITEIEEIYQPNSPVIINPTFGNREADILDVIKQALDNTKTETTK